MEESEKRKERLRAMRTGHEQDGQSSSTAPTPLLNPLAQLSPSLPGVDMSPPVSRFDYYTDPMSAYSANRRSGLRHQPTDSFSSPTCGSSQADYTSSPSPGQRRHYIAPTPLPANSFPVGYSPRQESYISPPPAPQYGIWGSPVRMIGPISGYSSFGMSGSPSATGHTHISSTQSSDPGFGQGIGQSTGPGRGSWSASRGRGRVSPFNNSGRSNNWQPRNYQSPSLGGGSSQKGRFSKESVSARESPWAFFSKLMVLDPWDGLETVVGCILEPKTKPATKDWLPESIRTKKIKVKETPVSQAQGSLADYIALAMEEAINDEVAHQ